MLKDRFGRRITYLRISVTDRCNLRCVYCMPPEGVPLVQHKDILSYDEIVDFTRYAVSQGINKVRLTGGEPLVRKGISSLIERIASIDGVEDLALTTNGQLLGEMARELKDAGLHRLNVSLDTMDPQVYCDISRGGSLKRVLDGISAAKGAGFDGRIKLNCVWFRGEMARKYNQQTEGLKEYAERENLELRFIKYMNLSEGEFSKVIGGNGGDCPRCNRIRLTSTGDLKPCLFSNMAFNIRKYGCEEALRMVISSKPEHGLVNTVDSFYNIGG
jgi:GTP 3',8-cyclase